MTTLIANLTTGKGTWGHVNALLREESITKSILITNEFGRDNFTNEKESELVVIDSRAQPVDLEKDLIEKLKATIDKTETEVLLNMVSGSGSEHMALMGALLKLGLGIRLVVATAEGMKEL